MGTGQHTNHPFFFQAVCSGKNSKEMLSPLCLLSPLSVQGIIAPTQWIIRAQQHRGAGRTGPSPKSTTDRLGHSAKSQNRTPRALSASSSGQRSLPPDLAAFDALLNPFPAPKGIKGEERKGFPKKKGPRQCLRFAYVPASR